MAGIYLTYFCNNPDADVTPVGASLLAKNVNDNEGILNE